MRKRMSIDSGTADSRVPAVLERMRAVAAEVLNALRDDNWRVKRAEQLVELKDSSRRSVDLVSLPT